MAGQLSMLLLVVAVALPVSIQGASVDPKSRFTYIGSYRRITVNSDGSSSVTNSDYYKSHNNAEWETAADDCKDIFDASLVSLETPEEVAELDRILAESGDAATLYWSGGKYDSASKKFKWVGGQEIDSQTAPWEAGQPGLSTRMSRVVIRTTEGVGLRSRFNTESARYICEIS